MGDRTYEFVFMNKLKKTFDQNIQGKLGKNHHSHLYVELLTASEL